MIVYNWIPRYTAALISPHSWITEYMRDLALPVNFIGTSTDDRRHVLPQKEVSRALSSVSANDLACNQNAWQSVATSDSLQQLHSTLGMFSSVECMPSLACLPLQCMQVGPQGMIARPQPTSLVSRKSLTALKADIEGSLHCIDTVGQTHVPHGATKHLRQEHNHCCLCCVQLLHRHLGSHSLFGTLDCRHGSKVKATQGALPQLADI